MGLIKNNSPSNIDTGWRQKYFYHVESDGILNTFIKIFQKNENNWVMKKDLFDQRVAQEDCEVWNIFPSIYHQSLEVNGEFIRLKKFVIEHLLKVNWQWSFRNFFKKFRKQKPLRWPFDD